MMGICSFVSTRTILLNDMIVIDLCFYCCYRSKRKIKFRVESARCKCLMTLVTNSFSFTLRKKTESFSFFHMLKT